MPSPFRTGARRAGRGSAQHGGTVTDVGHHSAFGNTEEYYHLQVLGCKERGHPAEPVFDHATGRGWTAQRRGDYDDALHIKNNAVVPFIVEATGGIAPRGERALKFAARRASSVKHGRDGTRYSKIRRGISYLAHHMQTISAAAVIGDAANIDIGITRLKMHVQALTPTGDSAA